MAGLTAGDEGVELTEDDRAEAAFAVEEGSGFGRCDLVYVRYVEPWSGKEKVMPFGTANLVFGGGPKLLEIAERFERLAKQLRNIATSR